MKGSSLRRIRLWLLTIALATGLSGGLAACGSRPARSTLPPAATSSPATTSRSPEAPSTPATTTPVATAPANAAPKAIPSSERIVLLCGNVSSESNTGSGDGSDVTVLDATSGHLVSHEHFSGQVCGHNRFAYNDNLTCMASLQTQPSGEILPGCSRPDGSFVPSKAPTSVSSGFNVALHYAQAASYDPVTDQLWWIDDPGVGGPGDDLKLVAPTGATTPFAADIFGHGMNKGDVLFSSNGTPALLENTSYTAGYIDCETAAGTSISCGGTGDLCRHRPVPI